MAAPLRFKNQSPKVPGSLGSSLSWQQIDRLVGMCDQPASPKLLCERCICGGFLTAKPLKPGSFSPAEICYRLTVLDSDLRSAFIFQTIPSPVNLLCPLFSHASLRFLHWYSFSQLFFPNQSSLSSLMFHLLILPILLKPHSGLRSYYPSTSLFHLTSSSLCPQSVNKPVASCPCLPSLWL